MKSFTEIMKEKAIEKAENEETVLDRDSNKEIDDIIDDWKKKAEKLKEENKNE